MKCIVFAGVLAFICSSAWSDEPTTQPVRPKVSYRSVVVTNTTDPMKVTSTEVEAIQPEIKQIEQEIKVNDKPVAPATADLEHYEYAKKIIPYAFMDGTSYLRLLSAMEAYPQIREILSQEYGIEYRDNRTIEPLPRFFTALSLVNTLNLTNDEAKGYEQIDTDILVVRLQRAKVDSIQSVVQLINNEPSKKFVLICDEEMFRAEVAQVLNKSNVIGIILGHYINADFAEETFADYVSKINAQFDFLRLVCDKPVILACSQMAWIDPRPNKKWAETFGDRLNQFDGFAIYNIHNFPAFEVNSRDSLTNILGLPSDKPTIVLDFIGTTGVSQANQDVWDMKKKTFFSMLYDQGWTGCVLISIGDVADLNFKASVIRTLPSKFRFEAGE